VQTANGSQPVVTRVANVTASGFTATLHEEEQYGGPHAEETVGYLAIYSESGHGELLVGDDGVPYLLQRAEVDTRWTPLLGFRLRLEEERSLDAELVHGPETVQALVLGDHLFAQQVGAREADTTNLARQDPDGTIPLHWGVVRGLGVTPLRVPIPSGYESPVVVVSPLSLNDATPAIARLTEVSSDRFEVRIQEWAAPDDPHGLEEAFYLVAEAGSHVVNGLRIRAFSQWGGLLEQAHWRQINLSPPFPATPAIFSAVQTNNDAEPVIMRIRNASSLGFEMTMREKEANDYVHLAEYLGCIAIQPGTVTTPSGRSFNAFSTRRGSTPGWTQLPGTPAGSLPTVVFGVQSNNGGDSFAPRWDRWEARQVRWFLQEETSADAETEHRSEDVGGFVGD
jgi:hypothetical protein